MACVISEGRLDVRDRTRLDIRPVDRVHDGNRMVCPHPDECIDPRA